MIEILLAASLAMAGAESAPAQRARANLAQYFSADDYPPVALERRAEGTVRFRLKIDADGRVTDCRVTGSSNEPSLDSATCAIILGRVRYEPARDSGGRAVAGTDMGQVTWRLPDVVDMPELVAPVRLEMTLARGSDERLTCAGLINGAAPDPGGADPCLLLGSVRAGTDYLPLPPGMSATVSVAIHLEGEEPPPRGGEAAPGDLLFETTLQLAIDPDGRPTSCRVVASAFHGPVRNADPVPDFCWPATPDDLLFAPIEPGGAARTGVVRIELHLRSATGQPTP